MLECSFLKTQLEYSPLKSFIHILSCQSRLTVTSCFVYKVIRDLESIDHLCINHIRRINTLAIYRFALAQVVCILPPNALRRGCNGKCIELIEGHALEVVVEVYKLMFYLTIVNRT